MSEALHWMDHDGLIHDLLEGSYVTACTGMYRPPNARMRSEIGPTCFECIAASFDEGSGLVRKNGEPGIIEWKTAKPK